MSLPSVRHKRRLKHLTVFDYINYGIMFLFMLICFYPFWTVIVASFSEGADYARGGVYFWPRVFTLDNYKAALNDATIVDAVLVSLARTIIGPITSVLFTAMVSYGMALKDLPFKRVLYYLNIVTMFIGGGLVPYFLLLKNLRLLNTFWVYIIPSLYSVYNMIIMSNFFREMPGEIRESALIDGADEFRIFFSICLPLSKAILATVGLWAIVGHWNAYYDSLMYTTDTKLQTLQLYLVKIIKNADAMKNNPQLYEMMTEEDFKIQSTYLTIRYATMAIATVPILFAYPFVQKHFAKGSLLGAVKG